MEIKQNGINELNRWAGLGCDCGCVAGGDCETTS